jgi:hypothetical protein
MYKVLITRKEILINEWIARNIMNYVQKDHVTLSVTFFLILEINVFETFSSNTDIIWERVILIPF